MMLDTGGAGSLRAIPIEEEDPLPPGDHLSLEQLNFELEQVYRQSASRLANGLGREGAMAQERMDFVHEAFTRLMGRGSAKRSSISAPGAYIAQMSRNLLRDEGRSASTRMAWCKDHALVSAAHHDQVVYLESRDRLRRLEATILKLREIDREIFLARRLDGLSYAQISDLTGLSPKAVERRMSKAIAKIMRLMDRA